MSAPDESDAEARMALAGGALADAARLIACQGLLAESAVAMRRKPSPD